MCRYGEADFDSDYVNWGFHDAETQIREAESVLSIVKPGDPLRVLDLACGLGTHAVYWARQGHKVTGVDLSQTFVDKARQLADREGVDLELHVQDIRTLTWREEFDLVTWIEGAFFDDDLVRSAFGCLRSGGCFVFDVRNPDHPKMKSLASDWRTWREEDGVFHLERHETNQQTGEHEDVWITIDPDRGVIEERSDSGGARTLADKMRILEDAGFRRIQIRTMEGHVFTPAEEPYWLWVVADK